MIDIFAWTPLIPISIPVIRSRGPSSPMAMPTTRRTWPGVGHRRDHRNHETALWRRLRRPFPSPRHGEPLTIDGFTVTLFPAGHILGARVAIDHGGHRVITGDYKTEPDRTAPAFELVPCDVFVTEATFGLPVFRHDPASDEIAKLLASVAANPGRCHVVGTYALGKAQRVLSLLRAAGYDKPVFIHGALDKLCGYYQDKGSRLVR